MVESVEFAGLPRPAGHHSIASKVGQHLYLSGFVAMDANGEVVGKGSIRAQTLFICDSISRVCHRYGTDLGSVTRCIVVITNRASYSDYDAAFAEAFGAHRPARATIISDLVNRDFLIEIISDVHLP